MSKVSCLALLLAVIILTSTMFLPPTIVDASPKTIVVPDDYSTITTAIGNATDGDTILVRSGNYQERTLTINKELTIIGQDKSNTKIINADNHTWDQSTQILPPITYAIQIMADNVRISGLTITQASIAINTNANGITLTDLNIPYGQIKLNGSNQTFAYNILTEFNADLNCVGSNNFLLYNRVHGGDGHGIEIMGSNNVIYGNEVNTENLVYDNGAYINLVGDSFRVYGDRNFVGNNSLTYGILTFRGGGNTVCGNILENGELHVVGNSNIFYANSIAPLFGAPLSSLNELHYIGIQLGNSEQDASYNLFYENNFVSNSYFPILVWVGAYGPEYFDNGKVGNYWSNYNGTDANGDGIGDIPYVTNTNDSQNINNRAAPFDVASFVLTDNFPLISPLDISSINIQLPSWANIVSTDLLPTVTFPPQNIPASTSPIQSPSPTPTVPELSWLIILPLLLSVFFVALVLRHRKQVKKV